MLIILNGYPGVGKLSIGSELIKLIEGRMLDIHSVYNVAFALTNYRSKAFYQTVRSIQDIADARILSEDRDLQRKPCDPAMVQRNHDSASELMGSECDNFMLLDTTKLSAIEAAGQIADWLDANDKTIKGR
ncbi:MAG: hypothetical protein JKY83_13210 [Rhizobiaceae bacterium]|nr:hypothetical protein [Rhizobiaceae bacterium]